MSHTPASHDSHASHDGPTDEEVLNPDWGPYIVLVALVFIGVLGFFGAFNGIADKIGVPKAMPSAAAAPATH